MLEKIIEACEWVNAKGASYTDSNKKRYKGGVSIEVTWANWEKKLWNPMFACIWKNYCDKTQNVNLDFNKLNSYYAELGDYLGCSIEMAEWYHLQLQSPKPNWSLAFELKTKYPRVTPLIPDCYLGNYLMISSLISDNFEEKELALNWVKNNEIRDVTLLRYLNDSNFREEYNKFLGRIML